MTEVNELYFPKDIQEIISGLPYSIENIGMSGSKVLIFDEMVLKIEKQSDRFDDMVKVMSWLDGKIPVPKVICVSKENNMCYLLMSRIKGQMSCEEYFLEHPNELCEHLANGLRMLWSIDISDCPVIRDIDDELKAAKRQVELKLYDIDSVEPDTFGDNGLFKSPEELYKWLEDNQPECEPCLSHGDYCLPNILINNGMLSGFIDLGDTGVGDKWRDIAICYRSLKHNFDGTYGGKVYENFSPDLLFEKLGIEPNKEKMEFYRLLDELF